MDSALTRRLTTRWRHYVWSVGVGLVAAGFAVSAAFDPGTLTATTRNAVRTTAAAYYPGLAWPHAAGLVMLLYHGPYVAGLFAAIFGFSLSSVLLHGWQGFSVTQTTSFDHDASLETVESILVVVALHSVVIAAAAYLPPVAFFVADGGLVNPFGAWVALGPLLVAGFGVAGSLAAAAAGIVADGGVRGAIAVVGLLLPLAGLQYTHVAPTRHPRNRGRRFGRDARGVRGDLLDASPSSRRVSTGVVRRARKAALTRRARIRSRGRPRCRPRRAGRTPESRRPAG